MLNKTVITLAFIATTTTGSAYAFTDATGGAWSGSLDFDGTISNNNPLWEFEVPPETVALTTDMTQYVSEGVVNGENTEFALTTLDDAVLFHGNIKERLPVGGPGMVPDILFGDIEVSTDTDSTVSVQVAATGDRGEIGVVTLSVIPGGASGLTDPGDISYLYSMKTDNISGDAAFELVVSHPDFGGYYPKFHENFVVSYTLMDDSLTDAYINQFQARAFISSGSTVSFPTDSLPSTWSASMPITVTVQ